MGKVRLQRGDGGILPMWRALGLFIFAWLMATIGVHAQGTCTKADFEAVVDEAAAALRDLNATHKPDFQERLRLLKDKRGWDYATFMKEAAPFVQDDRIREFDQQSAEFLGRINNLGTEGASAETPDCTLLIEVRANMNALVESQKSKWTYMFEKISKEIAP